jgi:hypothetical protein
MMPTRYHPNPSQFLRLFFYLSHIVALCVVWMTDTALSVQWLLSFIVVFSLGVYLAPVLNFLRNPIWHDFSLEKNAIVVFDGDEIKWSGVVLPQTVVTPYFVLLCVKSQQQSATRYQLICSDALRESEFRQLRMTLKLSQ